MKTYPAIQPLTKNFAPLPLHPLPAHLNTLPVIPGLERYSWNGFTKGQALSLFHSWGISEPLPKKGLAVIAYVPGQPGDIPFTVRVTLSPARTPDNKEWLYAFESLR